MAIPVAPYPCPKCGYTVCVSGPLTSHGGPPATPPGADGGIVWFDPGTLYLYYYCMAKKMGSCDYDLRVLT